MGGVSGQLNNNSRDFFLNDKYNSLSIKEHLFKLISLENKFKLKIKY